MTNLYSRVFKDVFNACEPYVVHDFLNVCGTGEGRYKYCMFSCVKIVEETIKILNKVKYNGDLIIPNNIAFDTKNIIPPSNIIAETQSYKKNKIVLQNSVVKLANAKEVDRKDRIILIPIDGISAFANGNSDFSIVIILQQETESKGQFEVQNISIFNPIRKDIFEFNRNEGCFYNDKKIVINDLYGKNTLDVVFVNDAEQKMSFDLTKLSQTANVLNLSTSIFSSLTSLFITNNNLCVAKINKNILPFIEMACKFSLLAIEKIGSHYVIGNEKIVEKIIKKN